MDFDPGTFSIALLEANLSSHPRCVTTSYLTFMVTETMLDSHQRLHESLWPTSSLAHRL